MKLDPLELTTLEANLVKAFNNDAYVCYAIIDKAQDATLLARFEKGEMSVRSKCLLPAALDSEVAQYAPHLVQLSPLAADSDDWPAILQEGARRPATFTLLVSSYQFDKLWASLAAWTEVLLPDDTDMILAFWDPAILGTLVGQKNDKTLHVPMPALTERQRARLLQRIAAWWYWDRDGNAQQILPRDNEHAADAHLVTLPLKLAQVQVEILIEAGMPDQLLSLIKENQPQLLWDLTKSEHYRTMEKHLLAARRLKLYGMLDILNYTCAALIYGDAMTNETEIAGLLEKVKAKQISLDAALDQFP